MPRGASLSCSMSCTDAETGGGESRDVPPQWGGGGRASPRGLPLSWSPSSFPPLSSALQRSVSQQAWCGPDPVPAHGRGFTRTSGVPCVSALGSAPDGGGRGEAAARRPSLHGQRDHR